MCHDSQQERQCPRGTTVISFKSWFLKLSVSSVFTALQATLAHPPLSRTAEHAQPRAEAGGTLTGTIQGAVSGLPTRREREKHEAQGQGAKSLSTPAHGTFTGGRRERGPTDTVVITAHLPCQIVGSQRASARAPLLTTFLTPSRGPGHQLPSVKSC